jgi:carbonic anhydrase
MKAPSKHLAKRVSEMLKKLLFITGLAASTLSVSAIGSEGATWSYSGENGPDNWGTLSKENETCMYGRSQSPIDLEGTDPVRMHPIETDYQVSSLALVNNGHTLQQTYEAGSWLKVGSKSYELLQFHMHSQSEHTVMGKSYPLELHFVHRDPAGTLAYIAVFVEEGAEHPAAKEFWNSLPLEPGQTYKSDTKINARDLMPFSKSYYRYMGSLTTPPCTEGVNWYVLKAPLQMSADQISSVQGIMGQNNRNTQPRFNRMILDTE